MNMIPREWLDKGTNAQSPVDALADFWRAFNNLFSSATGRTDGEKIHRFLASQISAGDALRILTNHSRQTEYLTSRPVIDMRGNGRDTSNATTEFRLESSNPQQRLSAIFKIIYMIRCNLEHGQKSPRDSRDIQLCENASPLVFAVVESSLIGLGRNACASDE